MLIYSHGFKKGIPEVEVELGFEGKIWRQDKNI